MVEDSLAQTLLYVRLHVAADVEHQVARGFEDGILQVELLELMPNVRVEIVVCCYGLGFDRGVAMVEQKQAGTACV